MGLSEDDVRVVREGVAAGRKPKVVFTESAGQIAGQLGQVVGLTDPAESDDWVVVKFGRDELPFSPADLVIAPRGAAPAPRKKAAEPVLQGPPILEPPILEPSARRADPEPVAVQAEPVTDSVPAPRKAARAAKPKAQPGLTVTLAYAEGEWLVSAAQGAKTLAKPYVIKPAEAMRMVSLVDVPGVQEAVELIVSAERKEAEQEAERLRAQLAEIESRLAELRDAG